MPLSWLNEGPECAPLLKVVFTEGSGEVTLRCKEARFHRGNLGGRDQVPNPGVDGLVLRLALAG